MNCDICGESVTSALQMSVHNGEGSESESGFYRVCLDCEPFFYRFLDFMATNYKRDPDRFGALFNGFISGDILPAMQKDVEDAE